MALRKFYGAETGSTGEFSVTQTGVTVDTAISGNTGGARSFKNDGTTTSNVDYANNLSQSSANGVYVTFRLRVDSASAPAAARTFFPFTFFDGTPAAVAGLGCGIDTSNRFYIYGTGQGGSFPLNSTIISGWTSGSWMDFEYFASNTTIWVKVNGTQYTGASAPYTGTPTIVYMSGLTNTLSDAARPWWIDDVCMHDSLPSPTIGVPSIIARQMGGNSATYNSYNTVGGATKYTNVSETPFSATNAVSSSARTVAQAFTVNSFSSTETGKGSGTISSTIGTVLGVKVALVAKASSSLNSYIRRRTSGVDTDVSITVPTTDTYFDTMKANTNAPWVPTITQLNASEFGTGKPNSTVTHTLEDIWVIAVKGPNQYPLVAAAGSYSMTGTAAGIKKGRKVLAGVGSYSMTGTAAGVKPGKKLIAGVGSYSMTGSAAGVLKNKKLPAAAGSYSMTGSVAGVKPGKVLTAGVSSYSLTGSAAGLRRGISILATSSSYTLTGSAAGVKHGWKLPAGVGQYDMTGSAAGLSKVTPPKVVTAGVGSYSMTGTAAGVLHGWKLPAASSSYSMTGAAAGVKHGWKVLAGVGSYSMTGSVAGIVHNWKLPAAAGSYSMTGQIAGLKHAWKLAAAPGSYSMLGSAAAIKHGWSVVAGAGTYALTGTDATIQKPTGKFLTAAPGSYALTGSTAGVVRTWKVLAGTASYDMVGAPASFAIEKPAVKPGMSVGSGGEMPPVHRQRDTRWDGVREAREEARRLFDKVPATPAKARKQAAVRASEAVAKVARSITLDADRKILGERPIDQLDRLLELQAYLQGLIDQQEAIRAAQAREAAEMWAMIERELILEAQREEELMIVMALAL